MYKKWANKLVVCFLTGLVLINVLYVNEEVKALERRGENLIRFHVLANSDSPEDQELKLKVRDKVIDAMAEDLEKSKDVNETREILAANLRKIEEVAKEEIERNGEKYDVRASLGEHKFPTKRYGNVVFPAGIYEALRIEIGKAKGQNWWCVMFPPLCFVDVKHGLTDEKTKQELKSALTEEEYYLVYSSVNEKELPLQLKSKVFELFKSSKRQLSRR
ncbi:stage II sporulation protein R [Alkaliphilus sp. MSJ-5]|uniref:Stage II sporulation protein R n=1 Tax=Alkaliphilus flagellatus TaxID=2841507 RepID=A0ABS6G402_9FIRM|nr:stage II sporulation protein R [Alkaliphilus flagellatus]MBU5676096.1 stage II sporulation protein R [Alkaliphilus flagellatus]